MPGQNVPSENHAAPRLGRRRPLPSGPDCPALSVRLHSCEVSPEASGSCRHPEQSEAGLQCRMRPSRRFPASPSPPRQIRSGFSAGPDMARPRIANPAVRVRGLVPECGGVSGAGLLLAASAAKTGAAARENGAWRAGYECAPSERDCRVWRDRLPERNCAAYAAGRRPGGRSGPPTRGSITAWGRARRAALGAHALILNGLGCAGFAWRYLVGPPALPRVSGGGTRRPPGAVRGRAYRAFGLAVDFLRRRHFPLGRFGAGGTPYPGPSGREVPFPQQPCA